MGFVNLNPDDFELPITPDMLDMDNPRPWGIIPVERGFRVATKFFDVAIHVGEDGKSSQLELDSRPAFEVAVLSLVKDVPHVMLIQKKRAEQTDFRNVEMITKVPGGYFHDGSAGNMDFVVNRILQETGYLLDPASVNFFGIVVGHTEVRTPIILGCATSYKVQQEPRAGVNVMVVPLEEALQMAENAVRRVNPFLENDTAFEGLMVIDRMLKRGEISLAG